jgi:hypothetical protein
MKSAQAAEVDIRERQPLVFASPGTTALGLWLTAFDMFARAPPGGGGSGPYGVHDGTSPLGVFDWHTTGPLPLNRCIYNARNGIPSRSTRGM